MDVVIAGGHGKIALRLGELLAKRGDRVRGLIRNPDHGDDLRVRGMEPVVVDLEQAAVDAVAAAVAGADAVVFAAGAGPGSGAARKVTMDLGGAVLLLDAAREAGVPRYVIVSSMGADAGAPDDGAFGSYLRAKGMADDAVRASDRAWTVVRPGGLTDAPGTGRVAVGPALPRGSVTRDDVAVVLVEVLDEPGTAGVTVDVTEGTTPVTVAFRGLATTWGDRS
ncbi:MAG: NAD(P)H-binding protein [Kineosporiaceae bacterium]